MRAALVAAVVLWLIAGCEAPVRPDRSLPATSVTALAAAIADAADRSDHEGDSALRSQWAGEAARNAEACLAQAPHAPECLYGQALAKGLEARVHPVHAGELLTSMLGSLAEAEAVAPHYDRAGPARVRALVLIRAPGWPLGPGDVDAGLAAARRAVSLDAEYPPNLIALGEALRKTGDSAGARDRYRQALAAAVTTPSGTRREDWVHEAEEGLRLSP